MSYPIFLDYCHLCFLEPTPAIPTVDIPAPQDELGCKDIRDGEASPDLWLSAHLRGGGVASGHMLREL